MAGILLKAEGTKLVLKEGAITKLVSTQKAYYTCKFDLDSEWDGFIATAIFRFEGTSAPVLLDPVRRTCKVPWEQVAKEGILHIGLFGVKGEVILPTNFVALLIIEGAAGEHVPPEPTEEVSVQIINELRNTRDYIEELCGVYDWMLVTEGEVW